MRTGYATPMRSGYENKVREKRSTKLKKPTFSFVVPTHREDRPLLRCLNSLSQQLGADDEVVVVGDVHDGPLPGVQTLLREFGPPFRYLEHDAGHHCFGHCQANAALPFLRGDYVHVNDDDDVWTPTAVASMRAAANEYPGRPLLFRFRSYIGGFVFWQREGDLRRNHVGGHCLVAPREKAGRFDCAYAGDFDWVASTIENCGGEDSAVWVDEIVCIARPT